MKALSIRISALALILLAGRSAIAADPPHITIIHINIGHGDIPQVQGNGPGAREPDVDHDPGPGRFLPDRPRRRGDDEAPCRERARPWPYIRRTGREHGEREEPLLPARVR